RMWIPCFHGRLPPGPAPEHRATSICNTGCFGRSVRRAGRFFSEPGKPTHFGAVPASTAPSIDKTILEATSFCFRRKKIRRIAEQTPYLPDPTPDTAAHATYLPDHPPDTAAQTPYPPDHAPDTAAHATYLPDHPPD